MSETIADAVEQSAPSSDSNGLALDLALTPDGARRVDGWLSLVGSLSLRWLLFDRGGEEGVHEGLHCRVTGRWQVLG